MSSIYTYSARVRVRDGKNIAQSPVMIDVYAFDSGDKSKSADAAQWQSESVKKLSDVKTIVDGANGNRILTICTLAGMAGTNLVKKSIDSFELYILKNKSIMATISCNNPRASAKNSIKNSNDPNFSYYVAVPLDLLGGDEVFTYSIS